MQSGDLYELGGDHWVLPIYVKEIQPALYQVQLADIPLLTKQRAAADEILSHHAQSRDKDSWYLNAAALKKIAIPAEAHDPQDIVVWNVDKKYNIDVTEFTEAYCQSRYAPPALAIPENFAIVWDGICKFMLDYILRGGEIDFGFARLEAFCVRANWKNWLMARMCSQNRRHKQVTPGYIEHEVSKMITLMSKSAITSLDKKNLVVRWWPEFTPTENFHARALQLEILRKQKVKFNHRYMTAIYRLVVKREYRQRLYEHFRAYARETAYPNTQLSNGFTPSDPSEAKDEPPLAVIPPAGWVATPVVLGVNRDKEKRRPVVSENAFLPKVQDIRSLRQDVWDPRAPMVASGEQSPEAGGLSLLFANKKCDASGRVLVRPTNGIHDGLAPRPVLVSTTEYIPEEHHQTPETSANAS